VAGWPAPRRRGRPTSGTLRLPLPAPDRALALVLSGGVALGAYEAGAFAALDEAGLRPDRLAGVSIGAINAVLIAGNPPERRVARLREFWEGVANDPAPALSFWSGPPSHGPLREGYNAAGVLQTLMLGRPGLFRPRLAPGADGRPGLYDLSPLRARLEGLVDFARLNGGDAPRLRIAATDVLTGERVVFEAGTGEGIGPDQVLASCAQMPVFAPIELGGRLLADGCYSGNTPLDLVLDAPAEERELLCLVVDLFDPRGSRPRTLAAAGSRGMDLMFGNQTRARLDAAVREGALRAALDALTARLPPEARDDPSLAPFLSKAGARAAAVFVLGYRAAPDEAGAAKGFDYTAATLSDRWEGGAAHARAALRAMGALPKGALPPGVAVHEVTA
jgi:NTE family protein